MTRFYPAQKQKKNTPSTPELTDMCSIFSTVTFVLKSGVHLSTDAESVEEEDDHILGTLVDGRHFALPTQNIDYLIEGNPRA